MKKTLFLAAAALGLATAANAQRNLDLEWILRVPNNDSGVPSLPCNDSFQVAFTIVNHGPESLVVGDTLWYQAPWTDQGRVSGLIIQSTVAAHDTVGTVVRTTHKNETKSLIDPTSGSLVYGNFANQQYAYYILGETISGVNGREADLNDTTDFSFAMIEYTCNGSTSVNELAKTTLNVYPNPANSSINFTHNFNKATEATVKVLDLMGRTVIVENYDVNAGSKNFNIDVTGLANGSYFVELTTAEERGVTKFTVSK